MQMKLGNRISILKQFLDDKTIEFIFNNNYEFLTKIPIDSLQKSANFFGSLEDLDYISIIKWFPIALDYDRFNLILNYLKEKQISDDEIANILEKSVIKDFEIADVLYENNYKEVTNNNNISLEDLKIFINKPKVNNETFNNLLNNDIKKYAALLRRLK